MKPLIAGLFCVSLLGSSLGSGPPATPKVVTATADNQRDGWFTERFLTPSNVSGGTFGLLHTWSVTGRVMAQPLIAPGIITSNGSKDLLIVTTAGGFVEAFDANNYSSNPVWSDSLGSGFTPIPANFYGEAQACISTPVIDLAGGYVYAVCANSTPVWTLYKIRLTTGAVAASTAISGQYPGTGDPSGGDTVIGGQLQFKGTSSYNRSGLALSGGKVYIGFGSIGDNHPYHGWVFAYDAGTLTQTAVICLSPSSYGAAVWNSAAGIMVDASGNLYTNTGNGGYDGVTAFGNSIVKLSPSLAVSDWFTPSNWATLETGDLDLSSSHAMLMSNGVIIAGGKDSRAYSMLSNCMGQLQGGGSSCQAAQLWTISGTVGVYGAAFANNTAFFPNEGGKIYSFAWTGTQFSTSGNSTSGSFQYPGGNLSYSSFGSSSGILWAVTTATSAVVNPEPGTLRAFNPGTLVELWNSDMNMSDKLGQINKYTPPVVWNGLVFVGASSAVYEYGLGAH